MEKRHFKIWEGILLMLQTMDAKCFLSIENIVLN